MHVASLTVMARYNAIDARYRSTFDAASPANSEADAAGGIMRYLEEGGVGYPLGPVRVPIVVGAVIFDLLVGDPRARPSGDAGYAACQAATRQPEIGAVGAGTGAMVAKAGGGKQALPGGFGVASARADRGIVAAVMVANSVGGIWDDERHEWVAPLTQWDRASSLVAGGNTTIGVVVTDAELTKEQANRVAAVAHDGIARAVRPAHTMYDGDTVFCLATGRVAAPYDAVEAVAVYIAEAGTPIVEPLYVAFAVRSSLLTGTDEGAVQQLLRRYYPTLTTSLPPDPRHIADGVPPVVTQSETSSQIYRSLPRHGRSVAEVVAATALTAVVTSAPRISDVASTPSTVARWLDELGVERRRKHRAA